MINPNMSTGEIGGGQEIQILSTSGGPLCNRPRERAKRIHASVPLSRFTLIWNAEDSYADFIRAFETHSVSVTSLG